jgi:hypothetical protein
VSLTIHVCEASEGSNFQGRMGEANGPAEENSGAFNQEGLFDLIIGNLYNYIRYQCDGIMF